MIHQIIELLSKKECSISELEKELQIQNRRNLIRWLEKIRILAKRKGWKFIIKPAYCKKCGYVFEEKIHIPSKCPKCKSEWISEPRFRIKLK